MILEKEISIYSKDYVLTRFKNAETSLEVVKGKISAVISETELDELQDGKLTLYGKLASAIMDIDSLNIMFADVSSKYDHVSGQYSALDAKVAEYKIGVDGLSANLSAVKSDLSTNYSTTTAMNAAIKASVDGLSSTVSKTYATGADVQAKLEATDKTAKGYADAAKDAAVKSANANTDELLKSYSTTTEMNSAITQKADSITSEVSKKYVETTVYNSGIADAKKDATTKADTAESNAKADTANKLKSYSTTTEMNSAISQKADSITSTVSKTYATKDALSTTDGKVTALETWKKEASLKITDDAIVSTVTKSTDWGSKANKKSIISEINQSAESVSISADKINFNGVVTANNYFKILKDGSMEAISGKIGGATILKDGIYLGGYSTSNGVTVYKCGMSSSDKKHAFWAGEDKWYVDYNGFMHAGNVDINGKIQAITGSIGGITIKSDGLYAGNWHVNSKGIMHAESVDLSGKFQTIKDDARVTIYDGKFQAYEQIPVEDTETGESLGYEWLRRIYVGINSKNNPSINIYGDVGELCASMNKNGFNIFDDLSKVCVSVSKKGFSGKVTTYDGDYKYAVGSSAANIWRTKVIRTITSKDNLKKLVIWGGYGAEGSSDTSAEKEEESHLFLDQEAVIALILDACGTLEKKMQAQIDALK